MAPPSFLVEQPAAGWRRRLHGVVFEAETPAGRAFDYTLLALILASVAAVLAESVPELRARHGALLRALEWGFTLLFTLEYGLRLAAVRRPLVWARSFYGVVDLLAVLPTYLALVLPGAQTLLVLRALRLLRIFRILKLAALLDEAAVLRAALVASRRKVFVFLSTVMILVLLIGSAMYLVEGEENGFVSIPISIYWAIVTLTTVGYGDLAPQTPLGRLLASLVMLLGYAILAVPTGIVTSELIAAHGRRPTTEACPACGHAAHDHDALYCKLCGAKL
ncbi:MAG: ion transporter [Thermoanaerobaculia bacterium]|nr:MAG: ion transporter [Thermoanaerobaculia bacterium]